MLIVEENELGGQTQEVYDQSKPMRLKSQYLIVSVKSTVRKIKQKMVQYTQ